MGIAKNDLEMRAKRAEKFLNQGHKVKIEIILRGREKAHSNLAKEKLELFRQAIPVETILEHPPTKYPRGFSMLIGKPAEKNNK